MALGVRGHARNLDDGRVELLACGEESALERFQAWLQDGPELARVDSLDCEVVELARLPDDFVVK
jgi:acylphosphatase